MEYGTNGAREVGTKSPGRQDFSAKIPDNAPPEVFLEVRRKCTWPELSVGLMRPKEIPEFNLGAPTRFLGSLPSGLHSEDRARAVTSAVQDFYLVPTSVWMSKVVK